MVNKIDWDNEEEVKKYHKEYRQKHRESTNQYQQRPEVKEREKARRFNNACVDCGKKIWSNAIRCNGCHRAKQICPVKDTSIEVKIQDYLKDLGIPFFTHQYMKIEHGYQCDILIPSLNIVIEADGDYWHKYPIGRNIDKIRTEELIEKGFKVLRLWECEIKKLTKDEFEVLIK